MLSNEKEYTTPGDSVVMTIRRSKAKLIKKSILPLLMIFFAAFLWYMMFSRGVLSIIVFWTVMVVGVAWLIAESYVWYSQLIIITKNKLIDIDQKNIFRREISTVSFSNIKEIQLVKKGLLRTFFKSADILITLKRSPVRFSFDYLPEPKKIYQSLTLAVQNMEKKNIEPEIMTEEEIKTAFISIKNHLGKKKFTSLIEEINSEE